MGRGVRAVRPQHGELRAARQAFNVHGAHVGTLVEAVGEVGTRDLRDQAARIRVIVADDGEAIERQVVQELDEAQLQLLEVAAVRAEVVGVDVGDDGDHRLQVRERGVALVGLGHQVLARTESRVAGRALEPAADHERGIRPAFGQHARDQAGRRGLAMRPGHRDRIAEPHQLAEHLGALHDRHALARAPGPPRGSPR